MSRCCLAVHVFEANRISYYECCSNANRILTFPCYKCTTGSLYFSPLSMLLSQLDFEDARPEQLSDPSHRLLQLRVADVQFDSPSSVNLLSQPLDSPRLGIYVANLGLTLWPPGVNHDQDRYSSSSSRSEIYRLRKSPGCHPFHSAWPTDGSG
jgi:hypothetical protein